jgi:hypothetical protein
MSGWELVRYRYGSIRRYTAFCLTPKLDQPKEVTMGGQTFTVTNQGASSSQARHFQRPATAKAWLKGQGLSGEGFDWEILKGTEEYRGR